MAARPAAPPLCGGRAFDALLRLEHDAFGWNVHHAQV
jgi:hypothetical protein